MGERRKLALLVVAAWLASGVMSVPAERLARAEAVSIAPVPVQGTAGLPPAEPPVAGQMYVNRALHVSFATPDGFRASEAPLEGEGTLLVIERDAQTGFQIFRIPYDEDQISEERIRLDLPDLVMDRVRQITLDGVPALAFASAAPDLGPTYEVWLARGGFLYQVMTRAGFEDDLQEILRTWRFLDEARGQ